MKNSKLGFLVLASVLGCTSLIVPACGGGDSSSSGSNSGGSGNETGGKGGQGGDASSTGGKAQGGSAGGGNVDKCADVECSDDGNPCTENVCNPETGTCGIPRTGTSCNDGLYCNGTDKCDNGECTDHAGMPCADGQACNEDQDACECNGDEDCPEVEYGEWSTPTYDGVCDTSGAKNRTVKTYACVSGICEATNSVENGDEPRVTQGTDCTTAGNFCQSKCNAGNCVPSTTQCNGGTPYCNEGANACWACEDDTFNGQDSACSSGAKHCCKGACGTDSCDTLVTDIVINTSADLVLN